MLLFWRSSLLITPEPFSTNLTPNRARQREAIIKWLSQPQYTHAITLNLNKGDASLGYARRSFGLFCHGVDRLMTGKRRVERLPSCLRFEAVAFSEHLETNLHLHVIANFHRRSWGGRPFTANHEASVCDIWREASNGLGTCHIKPAHDAGWARYITKEWYRPNHDFIHSWDFHPNESVVYYLPALDAVAA